MQQFERHARAYDAIRHRIAYPESLYASLSERCSARQAALDIGCGTGASTVRLVPYFEHVEGIDHGPDLVARARANCPEASFQVARAEDFLAERPFDLVTCATAFYWMDRPKVLSRAAHWLAVGGVFCAYRYEFPLVYGPARDVIERELALRWSSFRDPRLIAFDDTGDLLSADASFGAVENFVLPNVLSLDAAELSAFFLSTSYVTRFLDEEGGAGAYAERLKAELERASKGAPMRVNFDVHGVLARRAS